MYSLLPPSPLIQALLLALIAELAIPLGAALATVEHIRPRWLEDEFRHGVIAFGGGALLAAVALVLVPEGGRELSLTATLGCFLAGGAVFLILDRAMTQTAGPMAQLLAMLLDFAPEAMALGAALTLGRDSAVLLALLIALQNLPEGFNAFRELRAGTRMGIRRLLVLFGLLALIGPLCAAIGGLFLAELHAVLGGLMLFAAGGILYLIFQDIAPQVPLKRYWAPPLGAVAGFALGLAGHLVIS
jgi:ZIP family zinc transporter